MCEKTQVTYILSTITNNPTWHKRQAMELDYHQSKQRFQAGRGIFSSTRVQEVLIDRVNHLGKPFIGDHHKKN